MIIDFWHIIFLIGTTVFVSVTCVMVGGWIAFKSTRAVPGERFLGGVPKGEAFVLPDALDDLLDPPSEAKSKLAEKMEAFEKKFQGDNK